MSNNPKVTIIVPVFNRAELVRETIESVIGQSYLNWELILVDDGSTDESVNVLEGYAKNDNRITAHSRPATMLKGANACRNYGFSLATGKYIKWVDSDDILLPHALTLQVEILDRHDSLEAVFSQSIFFNNVTRQLEEPWSRQILSKTMLWDYIRNNIRWHTGGIIWRKSFFETPPFHESLKNSQEWLMHGIQLLKLLPEQYKITDDFVYHIRRGNLRMSSSRSAVYYLNQANARVLLLQAARHKVVPGKFRYELVKQTIIYGYHAAISWLVRRKPYPTN